MIKFYGQGSRHRYTIDGHPAISVTTALSQGMPKPALMAWAARVVAEFVADDPDAVEVLRRSGRDVLITALKSVPNQRRDTAAARGTEVHALAQSLIHGAEVDVPHHLTGFVDAAVRFMDEWKVRPLLSEVVVASRMWLYAGRLDLVGELPDGRRILWDYKTASGVYGESAMQLAGYRWAECYVTADGTEIPMSEVGIDDSKVVHLRPSGEYSVIPVRSDETVYRAFLYALANARTVKEMADWVLPAESPPC